MINNRAKQIEIQTAQSEAQFLLAWIRALTRHNNRLLTLSDRYPLQRDVMLFAIRETDKEIEELHEERAYWLQKLDNVIEGHDESYD